MIEVVNLANRLTDYFNAACQPLLPAFSEIPQVLHAGSVAHS